MGKNFDEEMALVPDTMRWASALDLTGWSNAVARMRGSPLVVVASGGSLSAGQLLAQLHMASTGRVATVITPLELMAEDHGLDATVLFLSASGSNQEILQAFEAGLRRGIRELAILCGATRSPLADLARRTHERGALTFDLPAGRDGFLATNSLVAFYCLILRMYGYAVPGWQTPSTDGFDALLGHETLVVLYGGWLKSVAVDIESRFVEAALGGVQVADFRNFAHGRHHWLAKRAVTTHVLALTAPRFADLADDTLRNLPPDVSVSTWSAAGDDPGDAVPLLLRSLALAGAAARRLGYDAGRPGVPEFGHRIYELKTTVRPSTPLQGVERAVLRKARVTGSVSSEQRMALTKGYEAFQHALQEAVFAGVVLDYDGTIVATHDRFKPVTASVAASLNRLLQEGMLLGIATGRGKSVHEELRNAIDKAHWHRCWIGYYNGAIIRSLDQPHEGIKGTGPGEMLSRAADLLGQSAYLPGVELESNAHQVTVTCRALSEVDLWNAVRRTLDTAGLTQLKVVRSSHSVDVLSVEVTKLQVVRHLAALAGVNDQAILKIGDRGAWPGNDAELLTSAHGISVDQVSDDPSSCWNTLPMSLRVPEATCLHLERLRHGRYVIESGG